MAKSAHSAQMVHTYFEVTASLTLIFVPPIKMALIAQVAFRAIYLIQLEIAKSQF